MRGGRPGLVIFTDVVSAFDISLSQVSGGRMGVLVTWLRIDLRAVCFSRMWNNKTNAKCWAVWPLTCQSSANMLCPWGDLPKQLPGNHFSFSWNNTSICYLIYMRQSMTVEDFVSFIPSMYCLYLQHFKLSVNIYWVNKWLILAYKAWVRTGSNSCPLFQLDQEMYILLLNYFKITFVLRERIRAFILNKWFQFLT